MEGQNLSTSLKALTINLDQSTYGVFAEIGGGQEVSRNFFQAGGASGTIAKTISAYDKQYSDILYSQNQASKRYVSCQRLEEMLDCEYDQLVNMLGSKRETPTRFFVYANTVSTINYRKDNISHGWIGCRFQLHPDAEPNEVVIHVGLHENDNLLQQNTLGIAGVNLIYACFYHHDRPNIFIQSLLDNLSIDRMEITMIRMKGPELSYVDNRLLAVQLVKNRMAKAIMFDKLGNVQEPADMLYKMNVLAFRGSFRPITYAGFDILKSSYALFKRDEDYDKSNTLSFCEITIDNLMAPDESDIDDRDFLDRVDLLNGMGQNVMVSGFREFYKLVHYFSGFRINKLRIVVGAETFEKIFDPGYYTELKGGILEAFGKLFPTNMKMYVYPGLNPETSELIRSQDIKFTGETRYLYDYLISSRLILEITEINRKYINIFSPQVLERIKASDPDWEKLVPVYVAESIKSRKLFGYKG
ncbi:MAG: hypothetical protein FD170_1013 [Bacteroidetes bacterium]|nr:MAG: hypothetical protein FD170_1013 [Bacteroidota bacterium]